MKLPLNTNNKNLTILPSGHFRCAKTLLISALRPLMQKPPHSL